MYNSLLITTIIRGGDQSSLKAPATASFTDVTLDGDYAWAAPYIYYGVDNGYINGMGDGTFQPAGNVTKAQLATMLLKVLGYSNDDLNNGNWLENVNGLATGAGLYNGLDTVNQNDELTRDQASLMMFNALQTDVVVKVDVTGKSGSFNVAYNPVKTSGNKDYVGSSAIDGGYKTIAQVAGGYGDDSNTATTQQLIEKYFDGVKVVKKVDKATGNPGYAWTKSNADKAFSDVYGAGSVAGTVTADTTKSDVNSKYNVADTISVYVNGDTTPVPITKGDIADRTTAKVVDSLSTKLSNKNLNGATIELIANDNGQVDRINITEYYLAKVDKVNPAKGNDDRSVNLTVYNTVAGTPVTKYATEDYAKDDYVLVAFTKNDFNANSVYAIEKAVAIDNASITSYKGEAGAKDTTVVSGGNTYSFAANYAYDGKLNLNNDTFKSTYTLYTVNNSIIGATVTSQAQTTKNYLVVDRIQTQAATTGNLIQGSTSAQAKVQWTKFDGTTGVSDLATTTVTTANQEVINGQRADDENEFVVGDVVYKITDKTTIGTGDTAVTTGGYHKVGTIDTNAESYEEGNSQLHNGLYAYTESDGVITLDGTLPSNDVTAVAGSVTLMKGQPVVTVSGVTGNLYANGSTTLTTIDSKKTVTKLTGYSDFPAVANANGYVVYNTKTNAVSEILVTGIDAPTTPASETFDKVGLYLGKGANTADGQIYNFLVDGTVTTEYLSAAPAADLAINAPVGIVEKDGKATVTKLKSTTDDKGYEAVTNKPDFVSSDSSFVQVGTDTIFTDSNSKVYNVTTSDGQVTASESTLNANNTYTFIYKVAKDKDGNITSRTLVAAYNLSTSAAE